MTTQNYGKCLENPILLNSIPSSRLYLDNLLTESGCHLVYHRLQSCDYNGQMIDHYEIMTTENKYDDIHINIYNAANSWIPPLGYFFDEGIRFFQYAMSEYEQEEINEPDINVEDQYILPEQETEELIDQMVNNATLEVFLEENLGTTSRVKNFPFPLIEEMLEEKVLPEGLCQSILKAIKQKPVK